MVRVPITRQGYNELLKELEHMKSVERTRIMREIEAARGHGDLSENAEYHAAKEKQGHVEAKIRDLENKLAESDIVDVSGLPGDKAVFGSFVSLENLETGERVRYQLVGPYEADIKKKKISVTSPIGRALMGKEPGDVAMVQAPGGLKEYEVISVGAGGDE
ncbi:MAG: transcription elongation factor GreA [Deltaproteobacteria bacterium]|nr:transcription elongation factor GreA [Deltaproteobacteria bacterium]MBW2121511.1 transcription elongation factor GreA [Deltaproteobacteria bacterium]